MSSNVESNSTYSQTVSNTFNASRKPERTSSALYCNEDRHHKRQNESLNTIQMLNFSDQWDNADQSGVYESDALSTTTAIENQENNPKKLRAFYLEFTQSVEKNKKCVHSKNGYYGEYVNL
jgi:hypothetical protein